MAAVSVVLPWSMCPIVPTLTCGLLRSYFSLAIEHSWSGRGIRPSFNDYCLATGRMLRPYESPRRDLNSWPCPYQGHALPTELRGRNPAHTCSSILDTNAIGL